MALTFEDTNLADTAQLRDAFELSYSAYKEDFVSKYGAYDEQAIKRALESFGASSFDETYQNSILRMTDLLQNSGASDDTIAACLIFTAVKSNPAVIRKVNVETADMLEGMILSEKKFQQVFGDVTKQMKHTEEFDLDSFFNAFSNAALGVEDLNESQRLVLKAGVIVAAEMAQNIDLSQDEESDFTNDIQIITKRYGEVINALLPKTNRYLDDQLTQTLDKLGPMP